MSGLNYFVIALVFVFTLLFCNQTFSIDYTTDDVATWQNATWTPGGIPGAGDNVTLLPGAEIVIDQNQACFNLTIEDDGFYTTLTINAGNTLTVNGNFDIDDTDNDSWIDILIDGTLQIEGYTTARTTTGNSGALWTIVIGSTGMLDLNTTTSNRTRFWMMQANAEFTLDFGGAVDAEGDIYVLTRNGAIATVNISDNITVSCRDWYQYVRSSGSTVTTNINGGTIDAADEIKFDISGGLQSDNVIDMGKTGTPQVFCNKITNPTEGTITNISGASFASNFTFDVTNGALVIPSDANIKFHNLIVENNVDASIGGSFPAAQLLGDLEIKTGGTFDNAGFTLDVTGDIIHAGDGCTLSGATTSNNFTQSGSGDLIQSAALTLTGNYVNSSSATQTALLTVGGDFTNSGTQSAGANIDISGDFTNNGIFTQNTNKVILTGGSAQTIGGTTTTDFYDLEINNSSGGVSLTNDINIVELGTLTLTSGTLTTTGQTMTLKSSALGTARIGEVTGGGISGDFTMQRFIAATPNWRILASPVGSTTIADWNTEIPMSCIGGGVHTTPHFTSVYTYDETALGTYDVGFSASDDPGPAGVSLTDGLTSGTGYMVYVGSCLPPCSPTTITTDLTGTLVTGDQTLTVNFTSDSGNDHDGWNMLGNPFPSDINWDLVDVTNGVSTTAYIYDAAGETYVEYNQSVPSSNHIIPSHQGFFAKASSIGGGAGTITIEEADKTSGGTFYKVSNTPPGFKLELSGNGYTDEVEVYFLDGTSDAYDPIEDALKLYSYSYYLANFSIVSSDSVELAQNLLPDYDQDYSLPLNINWIWPGVSSNFTISSTDFSGIPESCCIILEDTATGTFINLRVDTAYTFTMTPDTGLTPRFILHIGGQLDITATDETCPGNADGNIIALGSGPGPFDYEWEDESGNIIQDAYGITGPDTLQNIGAGTYTVTIYNNALCDEGSRTIEIFALEGMTLTTYAQDLECNGDMDGEATVTPSGGTAPFAFLWNVAAGSQTAATAVGLAAGTYTVSVTDVNNCIASETATITEPALMIPGFTPGADTAYLSEGGIIHFTNTSVGASSYYWDFGDGSTTTDASPWNLYNSAGTYSVMLVTFDGISCYDTAFNDVTVLDEPVSLYDLDALHANVQFLQNEYGVMVQFDFPATTQITLSVYNQLGQRIISNNTLSAMNSMVQINLSNESKGLYFIEVNTPKDRITKKVYF